jgi:hypothetical protein
MIMIAIKRLTAVKHSKSSEFKKGYTLYIKFSINGVAVWLCDSKADTMPKIKIVYIKAFQEIYNLFI